MSITDWVRGRTPDPDGPDGSPSHEPQQGNASGRMDPATAGTAPERLPRRIPRPADATPAPTAGAEVVQDDRVEEVAGERTIPSVHRQRSLQSRISNVLALGTILLLGGGFLVWYYSTQFASARDARDAAAKAVEARTAAEMKLAPLGRLDPPTLPPPPAGVVSVSVGDLMGAAPPPPQAAVPSAQPGMQAPPPKTPEQLALERQLGEPVIRRGSPAAGALPAAAPAQTPLLQEPNLTTLLRQGTGHGRAPGEPAGSPLAAMLQPTPTPAVEAQVVPTRRFLLPRGAFVDCTLETAIDSTYDGMVTCIGANDVYGADGKVVLLERGTKYIGEKRGETRQGQGRVFVLWSEARTPTGVTARLDSPGTDELGRAGLAGHVDTHFWDRFGAAILISVIDGSLQALVASQRNGNGTTVQLNPTGARDVMTEVLKGTVAIPPTIVKNQGDRIQVFVARDVDFRPVYALRTSAPN